MKTKDKKYNASDEKRLLIHWLSLIAGIFFGVYGGYYFLQGNMPFLILYVATLVFVVANFGAYLVWKNERLALAGLAILGLPVLIPWQLNGGIEGTGMFSYFLYVPWLCILLGKRDGIAAVLAVFLLSVGLTALQLAGVVEGFYTLTALVAIYFNWLVLSAMIYGFQRARERAEVGIAGQQEMLAKEVSQRQASQAALVERATELERTKLATLNVLEDLSAEKRQLEEAQARNEAVFRSMTNGLVVLDVQGRIVTANPAFEKLLRLDLKSVLGKKFTTVVPLLNKQGHLVEEEDRFVTKTLKEKKVTSADVTARDRYRRQDGTIFPVAMSVSPMIVNDEVIGAVEVFRDITKEEQIDSAKTEFVSLASHQLRTPLTAIAWNTEMLLDGDAGELNEKQADFLNEIYLGNKRMIELVNSLLNVSRLELGTFTVEPKPLNVVELIQNVLAELKGTIKQKHLDVSTTFSEDIGELHADPKLLRIVVQNLLSNAVKYTPDNGKVQVALFHAAHGAVQLDVIDTGYGIPIDQQQNIFSKFFRADNVRQQDTEGTGLGLYIVKKIVEESGGQIWFESEEGEGTAFHVRLPAEGMKAKKGTRSLS